MKRVKPGCTAWFAWLVAAAVCSGRGAAEERPPTKSYQIPYKLTPMNHVMVRLKINGKGPFNFIVDTGAPAIFCSTRAAKQAGAKPDNDGWGTFATMEIEGGLKLSNVAARIEDPFQLEGMNSLGIAGVELHGMLGYNLLAKYRVTYDFASDKLLLTELPDFEPGEVPRFGRGGQGGLEAIGTIVKFLAPLLNMQGPPKRIPRGYLGLELEEQEGVVVTKVYPTSPADLAGVQVGDRITSLDKRPIRHIEDLQSVLSKRKVQDSVSLTVERHGKKIVIKVDLGRGA